MKRNLLIICCVALSCRPVWGQAPAMTKAENRRDAVLAPAAREIAPVPLAGPAPRKAPRALEEVPSALHAYTGLPIRLPESPRGAVRTRMAPESVPLFTYREQAQVPKTIELPTQPLVSLPSGDMQEGVSIPILARPQKDRASVSDPTLDASLEAALKPQSPARTGPLPFVPLNLPDPFEFVRTGQLRNPPEENPVPPAIPLEKPR